MKEVKIFHLKIVIFIAMKYCCILHGNVCGMFIIGGEDGPVTLYTNYYRWHTAPDWIIYEYNIDFEPDVPRFNRKLEDVLCSKYSDILGPARSILDILGPARSILDILGPARSILDILGPARSILDILGPARSILGQTMLLKRKLPDLVNYAIDLGPVVQRIVSLTTSLRHQYMWTTLSNTLLFFVEKM